MLVFLALGDAEVALGDAKVPNARYFAFWWNIGFRGIIKAKLSEVDKDPIRGGCRHFFFFFLIVCFTSYFVFSIAVLPHSPGVVYYHLLFLTPHRGSGVVLST